MTAQLFEVFTIILPNPQWEPPSTDASIVPSNISFSLEDWSSVQTLSTHVADNESELKGLLYVPQLDKGDPCTNQTAPYIPENVTRRADFPTYQDGVPLVSLAPWISQECTQSFLAATRRDGVRAAIFFIPGNTTATPPQPGDAAWSLNDGGKWKSVNNYPVYAVPGVMGSILIHELALYSGNMTDVPYGDELTQIYDPRDFARLYTDISLGGGGPQLPSLWVFLIIVLGILLAVVAATSLIMHLIQRRHRRDLQRRIANGQVNLEALGIKRLNVPQEVLDTMPRYVYTSKLGESPQAVTEPAEEKHKSAVASEQDAPATAEVNATAAADRAALPKREVPFTQPTCSICLDDFENGQTIVRELPCSHIYHPECIDGFLRENSSLCPMCKKSSLPQGHCPTLITNAMVRRERLIRRMRDRVTVVHLEDGTSTANQTRAHSVSGNVQERLANWRSRHTRHHASAAPMSAREMMTMPSPADEATTTNMANIEPPPEIQQAGPEARRRWGRERLQSAIIHERTADDEARAMERTLPWCKFSVLLQSRISANQFCRAKSRR